MRTASRLVPICLGGALLLAACGAAAEPVQPTPPSADATSSPTTEPETESPQPSPEPAPEESPDDGDSGQDGDGSDSSTPEPSTIPTSASGTPLGLDDAFSATSGWEETRFEIADRSDVAGMGTEVRTCQDDGRAAQLEYRLANRFSTLTFSVGQSNQSVSSDQQLAVRILGNEEQLDIQKVPFNEVKEISVDVQRVNALKIRLFLDDDERCRSGESSVMAVIHDLELE